MTTLEKSRASLLASEGCKWATLSPNQLSLATENHFAGYGMAFGHGHGARTRDALIRDYLGQCDSSLAREIQPELKPNYQARVHRNLQEVIDQAVTNQPWTSAEGWAHDIVNMVQTLSWEYSGGTRLFGIGGLVGDGDDDTREEITWMVGGYLDPLGHGPDPEWFFYALAEDVLGDLDAIKKLTHKGVGEKAFGPSN